MGSLSKSRDDTFPVLRPNPLTLRSQHVPLYPVLNFPKQMFSTSFCNWTSLRVGHCVRYELGIIVNFFFYALCPKKPLPRSSAYLFFDFPSLFIVLSKKNFFINIPFNLPPVLDSNIEYVVFIVFLFGPDLIGILFVFVFRQLSNSIHIWLKNKKLHRNGVRFDCRNTPCGLNRIPNKQKTHLPPDARIVDTTRSSAIRTLGGFRTL